MRIREIAFEVFSMDLARQASTGYHQLCPHLCTDLSVQTGRSVLEVVKIPDVTPDATLYISWIAFRSNTCIIRHITHSFHASCQRPSTKHN